MLDKLRNRFQAKPPNAVLADRTDEEDLLARFTVTDDLRAARLLGRAYRTLIEMHRQGDRSSALHLRMSRLLVELGRIGEAASILQELTRDSAALGVKELDACGRLLLDINRPTDAVGCFESALRAGWPEARRNLCLALQRAGRPAEALRECARLLEADPSDVLVRQVEVQCHIDLGDVDQAESSVRRLLATDARDAVGLFDLGVILRKRGKHEDAAHAFASAVKAGAAQLPQGGALDLALAYETIGRTPQAIEVLCDALAEHPTPEIHRALGHALISVGSFERGWREHEFRWFMEPLLSTRARGGMRPWEGQDVAGRTVLLRIEQGVGDTIQFMRYASLLERRGARVIFSAMDLARCYAGVDGLLGEDCTVAEIDYYVNLMSLPFVFGTRYDSIPAAVPYLRPLDEDRARWQHLLPREGTRNVGLVWAGNPGHPGDRDRSMQLPALAPLLRVPGCRFFSLQKGGTSDDTRRFLAAHDVTDLEGSLATYRDTAAILEHMDLTITVDTSVAHLAGAMGRPVCNMLATPSEWRWGQRSSTTPWYPSMRLFRQAAPGDWGSVIGRVAEELASERDAHRPTVPENEDRTAAHGPEGFACPDYRQTGAVLNQRDVLLQYLPGDGNRGRSLEAYGEYLQPWLDFLLAIDLRSSTLLDLEAGYGEHVIPLSRRPGHGSILAATANRRGRTLLRQNLQANGALGVSVLSRAIAGSSSADADTIDDLCLPVRAWIKFDADTPIVSLLDGAEETLWNARPSLAGIVEGESQRLSVCARMADFGYRCSTRPVALFTTDNVTGSTIDHFREVRLASVVAIPEEVPDPIPPQLRAAWGLVDI